jgi:uncharacterized protein (TIGR02599 family)
MVAHDRKPPALDFYHPCSAQALEVFPAKPSDFPSKHEELTRGPSSISSAAFTILEVLVASAVLILLLGVLLSTISQTSSVTRRATSKVSAFQGARVAFERMTARLGQAALNSYLDYDDPSTPTKYLRKSELHFLIGAAGASPFGGTAGTGQAVYFQAPAGISTGYDGLETLLNAVGYFVSYGVEDALPAPFPAPAKPKCRYRLMQSIQPAEDLGVYSGTSGNSWVSGVAANAVPLAENIIYMAAWPRKVPAEDPQGTALTSAYSYDSRSAAESLPTDPATGQPVTQHQMPPTVQITIVAMDEDSASRICTGATPPAAISTAFTSLFQTSSQDQFDSDLIELNSRLADQKINFRVFTANVPIRESKRQ